MSERGVAWEQFEKEVIPNCIKKIKEIKKEHRNKVYGEIKQLGDQIEKFLSKDNVSSSLKHYLKGIVPSKTIDRALMTAEERKAQRKKKLEQSTSHLQTVSVNADKKDIEQSSKQLVSASTMGQSITNTEQQTEPTQEDLDQIDGVENENKGKKLSSAPEQPQSQQQQQPQEPNIYDGIKQKYEQEISKVKAEADKYLELLNKESKEKRDLENKPKIQNEIILSRMILGLLQTRAIPERLKEYPQTIKFRLLLQGFNEKGNEVFNLEPII